MTFFRQQLAVSPTRARVIPFFIFLILTSCQGQFGPTSAYWFYLAKTVVGAWLLWEMRGLVTEMKWALSWEAVVVGFGIFALWVGLDGLYPNLNELFHKFGFGSKSEAKPWNPHVQFGENSGLAWVFIVARFFCVTLVVPPLEEVFYRSFFYRWIVKPDFQTVALNHFSVKAFLISALVFGFAHQEWIAGILCAMSYQWLVLRKNRLGDAMAAHAITNFLLGIWVVWRGAWNFW
jgi:CAAX prenyl protease-like protein